MSSMQGPIKYSTMREDILINMVRREKQLIRRTKPSLLKVARKIGGSSSMTRAQLIHLIMEDKFGTFKMKVFQAIKENQLAI